MSKPKRNDPCPCGSGKKYKKCCEGKTFKKKVTVVKSSNLFQMFNKSMEAQQNFFKNRKIKAISKRGSKFTVTNESFLSNKAPLPSVSPESAQALKEVPEVKDTHKQDIPEEMLPYYQNESKGFFEATQEDYT